MSPLKLNPRRKERILQAVIAAITYLISAIVSLAFIFRRQRNEPASEGTAGKKKKRERIVGAAAVVVILICLASIFFTYHQPTYKPDIKPDLALGQMMAEEPSKLLGNKGKIVVVTVDAKETQSWAVEFQMKAFLETLSRQGEITVTATETLGFIHPTMPSSMFFSILEKHPNISAIVSFVEFPMLSDEEMNRLGENTPKVVAFFPEPSMGLKKLFEDRIVHVAIMHRFDLETAPSPAPRTLREWINHLYIAVTPETASSLPF